MRIWDLKTGRCLRKSAFPILNPNNTNFLSHSFYYYHVVEAHSPFVQCVAWAPAPLTEGSEDTDRILNVVATGGTDKVYIRKLYTYHAHPLTTTAGYQNMATLINNKSTCLGFS